MIKDYQETEEKLKRKIYRALQDRLRDMGIIVDDRIEIVITSDCAGRHCHHEISINARGVSLKDKWK